MNRLTNEQRLQIIEFYYQNAMLRKYIARFFHFMISLIEPLKRLFGPYRTKFTLLDIKPPTRLRRVRTEENIADAH